MIATNMRIMTGNVLSVETLIGQREMLVIDVM